MRFQHLRGGREILLGETDRVVSRAGKGWPGVGKGEWSGPMKMAGNEQETMRYQLCAWHFLCLEFILHLEQFCKVRIPLVFILPEVDPEIKTWMQSIYGGSDSRKQG